MVCWRNCHEIKNIFFHTLQILYKLQLVSTLQVLYILHLGKNMLPCEVCIYLWMYLDKHFVNSIDQPVALNHIFSSLVINFYISVPTSESNLLADYKVVKQ